MARGRQFQIVGAATAKLRDVRTRRTNNNDENCPCDIISITIDFHIAMKGNDQMRQPYIDSWAQAGELQC